MGLTIILGAGLSGLTAAYELKKRGSPFLILEARSRLGGRIHTVSGAGRGTPIEMGATWFGSKHLHLLSLLAELNVPYFNQYGEGVALMETMSFAPPQKFEVPPNDEPYHRVVGGSKALLDALAVAIGMQHIRLNTTVRSVRLEGEGVLLTSQDGQVYTCQAVISTLPPRLLLQSVRFEPALPEALAQVMASTHTWMSESVKFALEYHNPFWRNKGYSGTIFSQSGPATEVYDHTDAEGSAFALKGFLAGELAAFRQEERLRLLTRQMDRLLGAEASDFLAYEEKIWPQDPFTHAAYDSYVLPHQNNGHPLFAKPVMDGRFFLAGAETSPEFGGYMDGAVFSGRWAAGQIGL
ncbi:MAG: FAD-dependent oxidoreductase [Phaeodactylibacter sp.]|nr:FAD-dependent oxidoreductase [Phaeodactylibacter sp.]MCB9273682.1 FAD-dependent oxidoreductase [Lewinellaceae bacterium]